MTIGSQTSPEYWPPVHQLMNSGWYRAGAPWDSNSMEWGLRFGQSVDAETALRCWITAVDEDGPMPGCGAEFSVERTGATPDVTELAHSSSAPSTR